MSAARTAAAAALLLIAATAAQAQGVSAGQTDPIRVTAEGSDQIAPAPVAYVGGVPPVMDNTVYAHAMLEQFEDRTNGGSHQFRYDGQGWVGTDENKLWVKSEGLVESNGRFTDGQHEVLYDRAVSSYFDLQGGVRVDLDSDVTRTWAAFGVQGLSLYFFDVEATAYLGDQGRAAARLKGSYDLLITNRLILQPEAEMNFYSKADPQRGLGSGLSDIDAGLRLRYEFSRKVAPYIGVTYTGYFGQAQGLARRQGERVQDVRFTFGLRSWF